MTSRPAADERIDQILTMIMEMAAGNHGIRVAPSDRDDDVDAIMTGLNMLCEELVENIQHLKTAQENLLQSQKMAAVGQLIAGMAHEINNPLGVILGFAQGLERRVPEGDVLHLPVTSIVREAWRCKNLVQELLVFSRTGKKTNEKIELNSLVRSSVVLLETRAKLQGVRLVQSLCNDLPLLNANKTQLQQVLVNLGTNALDAMADGGTLTLRTQRNIGGTVILEVADTGTGVPEDLRSRIFEPFFTTKEIGKGTGLGLSLVWEIVQQHGGVIDVESEAGTGTTVRIQLPIT
jgi:two-component system NtrC family sensor kinase